jgi:ABC-type sugar transport system permease subunit
VFLVTPALGFLLVFVVGPIIAVFGISLTRWPIIGTPSFVGLANFQRLLGDGVFWVAMRNTLLYAAILVPGITALSLALALLLHAGVPGDRVLKPIYVLPVVAGIVVTSNIWKGLLGAFGPINQLLAKVGLPQVSFFSFSLALISVCTTLVWRNVGYYALFFLAGLASIDPELYDAAAMDGAGAIQSFRHITLPLLRPIVLLVTILLTIGSFQIFTVVYILTGGGPAYATISVLNYIYETGWRDFSMGYAAAQAAVFFVILLALSLTQWRVEGEEVAA